MSHVAQTRHFRFEPDPESLFVFQDSLDFFFSLSKGGIHLHLQPHTLPQLLEERADPIDLLAAQLDQPTNFSQLALADGQNTQTMLMLEGKAGILGNQFLPEFPDAEIENSFHNIVEQDHTAAADTLDRHVSKSWRTAS